MKNFRELKSKLFGDLQKTSTKYTTNFSLNIRGFGSQYHIYFFENLILLATLKKVLEIKLILLCSRGLFF